MLSDFPARRQPSPQVIDRRRATLVARPFLGRLEQWNTRAAKANATMLARVNSADQASHQQRLGELLAEVELGYEEFRTTIADEPAHGRLDDVRAAFERLLSSLRTSIGS